MSTEKLPDGAKGRPYQAILSARGGKQPFRWQVFGLPPGIRAKGDAIVGTPTATGAFDVVVLVMDATKPVRRAGLKTYTLKLA